MTTPSAQAQTYFYRHEIGGLTDTRPTNPGGPTNPTEPTNPGGPTSPGDPSGPTTPLEDIGLSVSGTVAKIGAAFSTPAPVATLAQAGLRFYTDDDLTGSGMSLDPQTGVISGTVAETGTKTVNLTVTDDTARTTTKPVDIEIVPKMALTVDASATVLPDGQIVPIKIDAADAYGSVTWNPVDAALLPPGVTFNTAAGQFEGSPTKVGTYGPIQVTGRDELDDVAYASTTIVVEVAAAAEMANLDLGDYHTCALTPAKGIKCWGYNNLGQLGNGTNGNSPTPVDVNGLTSGVKAIAIGSYSNCAIVDGGGVKCWGGGSDGQLGNGASSNSPNPVNVTGLSSGAVAIAKGDGNGSSGHACVVMNTGGVKCWGNNAYGQLGNGDTVTKNTPVDVKNISDAVAVTVGSRHSCALTSSGGVKCWGFNSNGQLGNGNTTNQPSPVDVVGLTSGVVAISAGGDNTTKISTCAVTAAGGVKCWGSNSDGQLGNNSSASSSTPVDVLGITSYAVSVHVGNRHACASTTSGEVKCWGWNGNGQLGNGSKVSSSTPVSVSGITSGAAATATGYQHSCAVMVSGVVKCWGANGYGQLGDGTQTQSEVPVTTLLGS